jgi:hypothetical protein
MATTQAVDLGVVVADGLEGVDDSIAPKLR